jgi:hypothetical protein
MKRMQRKMVLMAILSTLVLSTSVFAQSITIKASVSPKAGGTISPSGKVGVEYGGSQRFTITPNTGYQIKDVLVDGVSQGAVNIYALTDITEGHSIKAKFAKETFTVTIAEGGRVTVSPAGKRTVTYGKKLTLKIKPESEDVAPILLVNGQPVEAKKSGKMYRYVLTPVGDTSVYATSAVEPVLADTTKVLDEAAAQNLLSVSEDGSVLTFNGMTPYLESLRPGDVIMSGATVATPYGLLRKVTNITMNNSQITVETTGAVLEDIMVEGEITVNRALTASDITSFVPLKKGVTLREIPGPLSAKKCVDLHQVLWDGDDNLNTTVDQVVVNGALCFDADFNFALGVGRRDVVVPYVKNLTFSTTLGQSTALSFENNYSWSFSKEVPIATIYFGAITAGPLVFTPKLTIYAGMNAALVAGMTYGATQSNSLTLGVSYSDSDGWNPIADHTSVFQVDSRPVFYARATATGYAALSFDFLLYGVAGTYTKPKVYLGLDLDPLGNPWLDIYAGISASAGVKAEIYGYGLSAGFDLFDYRESILTLAGNKPPMITSLTASSGQVPRSGTSTITVVASDPENDPFTCSWSTDGGTLSRTEGCDPVTWTAPLEPGVYTVSVSVADNKTEYGPSTKMIAMGVLPMWTLTVAFSGNGGGVVTGTGGIDCGTAGSFPHDVCSVSFLGERGLILIPTANRGSTFTSWQGCDSISNGYICEVTLDQNKTVTAAFGAQYYTLSVEKSGSGSGTVTGTGINCGLDCSESLTGTVTLTAAPGSNSEIWNWLGCDNITGDTWNICTLFMDSNKTVTARFSARYTLSVQKSGDGSGTVTGTGIDCGLDCSEGFLAESNPASRTVVLTATPGSGSRLTSWSGCDSINGNTCTVSVNSNKTVTAAFAASYTLSIDYAGTGWGYVASSPSGSECGINCYYSGTAVTLTATPNVGHSFTGWSGCDSVNGNTCTVTMNQNRTVTATFTLQYYQLSVQKSGTGSGLVTGQGINCGSDCSETLAGGTSVTLTANGNSGSTLTGWSGCDSVNGNTCTVNTINQNKTVTATFTLDVPQYTLLIQKVGTGSGTVTGGGIDCGSTCSLSLAGGTSVTLTAAPSTSSSFTSWSGCDSINGNTCTVTLNQNRIVTATFTLEYRTLTIQKGGCGSGIVTGTGINCGSDCSESFVKGTAVTAPTATPDSGAVFARYYVGTTHRSSNTWTMNDNQTVTALFGLQAYNLCVQPAGNGGGSVTGHVYSHSNYSCYLSNGTVGGTCASNWPTSGHYYATLYANPYQGSWFDGWTGPCNRTGHNSSGYWCETIWIGQDGWPFEAFVATFTSY